MKRLLGGLVALLLAGFTAALGSLPAQAITNGEPDNGRHPYVGLAVFDTAAGPAWRCSVSLLSPTVVLTAGHCTDGAVAARVWFDENVQTNPEYPFSGATSYDGVPYTNPDFCIGCGGGLPGFAQRDVGIIVLSEPVPTSVVSEYADLPTADYVDEELGRNAPVTLVGYGVQQQTRGNGPPVWSGVRVRLMAEARLVSGSFVHSDEFIRVTANPAAGGGTCFGDSGGPVLDHGTDTVLAVNSYVTNGNCTGVTYSQRVDIPEVLEWIESFL